MISNEQTLIVGVDANMPAKQLAQLKEELKGIGVKAVIIAGANTLAVVNKKNYIGPP